MTNDSVYQERFTRIKKAIACEPVGQVPVIFMGSAFAPRYMGMSMAKFCSDFEAASWVNIQTMDDIGGFDGCQMTGGSSALILTTLWLSKVNIPGVELPEDSLWQIQEAEVMKIEDYDEIVKKGWNRFFMEYLPRVVDMNAFGAQMGWNAANGPRIAQATKDHDYVTLCDAGTFCNIPFEYFCGGRSMTKFIFDLHRIPDKVEEAMRVVQEASLAQLDALPPCSSTQVGATWVGGWRSASALISPKIWNRFVWPYITQFVDKLVSKGYTPILHWDQDWTRDLFHLNELPAKKCVLNPDGMTDVRKFREIVGDNMSMLGDVPASIFAAGTPDEVYAYVRDLVKDIGATGLLLCPGCDAPINTKPENMKAFVAAGREYGRVA